MNLTQETTMPHIRIETPIPGKSISLQFDIDKGASIFGSQLAPFSKGGDGKKNIKDFYNALLVFKLDEEGSSCTVGVDFPKGGPTRHKLSSISNEPIEVAFGDGTSGSFYISLVP